MLLFGCSGMLYCLHMLNFFEMYSCYHWLVLLTFTLVVWLGSGTRIKTRKRNITIPLDPASFSDAVVQIYLDNAGDLVIVAPSFMTAKIFFCINMLLINNFICLSMIFLYRNSLPGTLSLQNLTSQDTGTPSLRYSFWWCCMLTHFQYWTQYCLMWTSFFGFLIPSIVFYNKIAIIITADRFFLTTYS